MCIYIRICVIYIYICVILKSPMSPWCVLLTWQGAKKAILWTAVPSWNQEPRCFGGGTITMFSTFHWNIHCRFFPTSYASVIRSSWPWRIAKVTGNTAPNLMMTPLILLLLATSLCKPAAHNAHKQLTDAMNNLQHLQRLRALVYKASVGLILWRKTTKIDEDLGPWKVGVGQSLPEIYQIWDR